MVDELMQTDGFLDLYDEEGIVLTAEQRQLLADAVTKGKPLPTFEKAEDFLIIKYNKTTGEEISKSVDIDKVSDWLISRHNFRTWFGTKSDYSFSFNGRVFEPNTRGIVKVEVEGLLGVYCKRNIVDEIFEKVKRKTEIDKDEFQETDKNFICLENGVWDIKNKLLVPHDPKYKFQKFIPRKYGPSR